MLSLFITKNPHARTDLATGVLVDNFSTTLSYARSVLAKNSGDVNREGILTD
jgi:hypothetical protein